MSVAKASKYLKVTGLPEDISLDVRHLLSPDFYRFVLSSFLGALSPLPLRAQLPQCQPSSEGGHCPRRVR